MGVKCKFCGKEFDNYRGMRTHQGRYCEDIEREKVREKPFKERLELCGRAKELYEKKEWGHKRIANHLKISKSTVGGWILRDVMPEPKGIGIANHIELTDKLRDILTGLVLGDGTLGSTKGVYYQQDDSYKEYILWLSELLSNHGLKQAGEINMRMGEKKDGGKWVAYHYCSKYYRELIPLKKWLYPNNTKSIPKDLEISPSIMLFWFVGDGSYYYENSGDRWVCRIVSSTFKKEKLELVLEQLQDIGITSTVLSHSNRHKCLKLRIGIPSHDDFFEYILSSGYGIPDGYEYKFPKEFGGGAVAN